jgi:hypothetical protein
MTKLLLIALAFAGSEAVFVGIMNVLSFYAVVLRETREHKLAVLIF